MGGSMGILGQAAALPAGRAQLPWEGGEEDEKEKEEEEEKEDKEEAQAPAQLRALRRW